MEGDHRVWPPRQGPGHRRSPPEDTGPASPDEEGPAAAGRPAEPPPAWGRRGRPYAEEPEHPAWRRQDQSRGDPTRGSPPERGQARGGPAWEAPPAQARGGPARGGPGRRPHPLDLEAEATIEEPAPAFEEPAWNPRITSRSADDSLPPSARLHGSPKDPGARRAGPHGERPWQRVLVVLAALLAGTGLAAGATAATARVTAPRAADTGRLSDALAGVAATLPQGWSAGAVPPVTGFTSVVRDGRGGLVMARPVQGPVKDAGKATEEAAGLYSRLLLRGDRVTVVEDRRLPGGHTRALRAEYAGGTNRPAYLRVMLLTRESRPVLLVGLLQPEETRHRQALDAVMTSFR
ncbi:hypothetical protein HCN51_22290 [Nonomuraea sp. FMUSA5-5]|uniref:DUF1795 domain-containing protein n=1 Tax=Nonomuraea composti TaxID=2720023 RepID=A0ABX1B8U3_9ACTN|nr:hypothetical protein [Nonomuraea sp. FMUSA5-5]NJP92161.1 hypothetical protein [Nonomuraea sp. FMUSA5-5]